VGIILDSSILIAAERQSHTVRQILEQVRASQGEIDLGLSVVSVAELIHGAYRSREEARQRRRLSVDRVLLASDEQTRI
jgi:predicted nucleic acid-binding protein